MWPWFGISLATASPISDWANAVLLLSLVAGAISTYLLVKTAGIKEGYWDQAREASQERVAAAKEQSAKLAVELEHARNDAKQIDANLLREQRLTADERWRLRRVERAVLPRTIFVDWAALVSQLKTGAFLPMNIAVPDGPAETAQFGANLSRAFELSGLLKRKIRLPRSISPFIPISSGGATLLTVHDDAKSLGELLWHQFRIGGTTSSIVHIALPPEWSDLPRDENCLLVLDNNVAFGSSDGRDGERLDENGRPVPPP